MLFHALGDKSKHNFDSAKWQLILVILYFESSPKIMAIQPPPTLTYPPP